MKIIDTAQVLARIQAFNNRNVDQVVITSWHEILEPYELADCLRAVTDHFRASKDWIMPSDITNRVNEYRADRINSFKYGIRLSDADEKAAVDAGTWSQAQAGILRLAGNGRLTPDNYDDYLAGRIQLQQIATKELSK